MNNLNVNDAHEASIESSNRPIMKIGNTAFIKPEKDLSIAEICHDYNILNDDIEKIEIHQYFDASLNNFGVFKYLIYEIVFRRE